MHRRPTRLDRAIDRLPFRLSDLLFGAVAAALLVGLLVLR